MYQKLYVQKGSTVQACSIYDSVAMAGNCVKTPPVIVNGSVGYIPLYNVGDPRGSIGRVTIGDTTYAIGLTGVPQYSTAVYEQAGTYTFTVPAGCTRIRVTSVGGGGGAALQGYWGKQGGSSESPAHYESAFVIGRDGGYSGCGGINANGGIGGLVAWTHYVAYSSPSSD